MKRKLVVEDSKLNPLQKKMMVLYEEGGVTSVVAMSGVFKGERLMENLGRKQVVFASQAENPTLQCLKSSNSRRKERARVGGKGRRGRRGGMMTLGKGLVFSSYNEASFFEAINMVEEVGLGTPPKDQ